MYMTIESDQLTVFFCSSTVHSSGLTWFTVVLTVTVIWKAAAEMICLDLSFRRMESQIISLDFNAWKYINTKKKNLYLLWFGSLWIRTPIIQFKNLNKTLGSQFGLNHLC